MNWNPRKKGRDAIAAAENVERLPVRTDPETAQRSVSQSVLAQEDVQLAGLQKHLSQLQADRDRLATSLEGCDEAIAETSGCIDALEPAIKKINGLASKKLVARPAEADAKEQAPKADKEVVEA